MATIDSLDYLLFDGAFGTYYSKKYHSEQPCELACIQNPNHVLEIHKEYIEAGAMAIKTNTFAANTVALKTEFSTVKQIIQAAWNLANQAAEYTNTLIFADIGPIFSEDDSDDELYKIVDIFLSLGTTYFLLETAQDTSVFTLANYIKQKKQDVYIITSFAVDQDGYTRKGIPVKKLLKESKQHHIDAFGLNCMCGPSHLLEIVSELSANHTISVMPNSGYPLNVNGRTLFIDNETYFSTKMMQIHQQGVKILGGCCGTTPQHIQTVSQQLKKAHIDTIVQVSEKEIPKSTTNVKNVFAERLAAGKQVIAVELDPPFNTDYTHIKEAVPIMKNAGVDVITIADSPLARARANSFMLAANIQREANISVIPHLTCRDQNMVGLKSILLGGNIAGIRNVLVVTGDPVPADHRNEIKGVFSKNSYQLMDYIRNLNEDIFENTPYLVGGALNVNSYKFEFELKRAIKKQEKGVQFLLTQPIYTTQAIQNLKQAKKELDIKILAGLMPIVSYRNAVFLNNEVGGIDIPENIVMQMENKSSDQVQKISLSYCIDIISEIGDDCDGYYLMTPLKKHGLIVDLIRSIKKATS